jgi:hypothetical protein
LLRQDGWMMLLRQGSICRNGFSRERMGEQAANAFDEAVRKVIAPFLRGGSLTLSIFCSIVWGTPQEV